MATVCKICAGPIEPPDQHYHCITCLVLAHAEAALDKFQLWTLRGPAVPHAPGPPRYGSRPNLGEAHCRQHVACGPPLSWWQERRLAAPPKSTVAPFPGLLPEDCGVCFLWPGGGGWLDVHFGLGEGRLGGIGGRSDRQLGAPGPPRGAYKGYVKGCPGVGAYLEPSRRACQE